VQKAGNRQTRDKQKTSKRQAKDKQKTASQTQNKIAGPVSMHALSAFWWI
jgi:hypothetical protein